MYACAHVYKNNFSKNKIFDVKKYFRKCFFDLYQKYNIF